MCSVHNPTVNASTDLEMNPPKEHSAGQGLLTDWCGSSVESTARLVEEKQVCPDGIVCPERVSQMEL